MRQRERKREIVLSWLEQSPNSCDTHLKKQRCRMYSGLFKCMMFMFAFVKVVQCVIFSYQYIIITVVMKLVLLSLKTTFPIRPADFCYVVDLFFETKLSPVMQYKTYTY